METDDILLQKISALLKELFDAESLEVFPIVKDETTAAQQQALASVYGNPAMRKYLSTQMNTMLKDMVECKTLVELAVLKGRLLVLKELWLNSKHQYLALTKPNGKVSIQDTKI